MYAFAWPILKANAVILIAAAIALAVLEMMLPGEMPLGGVLAGYGLVAYLAHRTAVLGPPPSGQAREVFELSSKWPFLWRYFATVPFVAAVMLAVLFMASPLLALENETARIFVLGVSVSVGLLLFALVLAQFGTVFPAAATGGDKRLASASRRGRLTFWRTMARFLIGPALCTTLGLAILSVAVDALPTYRGTFDLFVFLLSMAGWLLGLINTVLAAVVLSLAYLEAEATPAE
ncbi:hypothetical protein [Tropicimonas sp. S265A]|uniref:hypothetical protein n=1 Tax=Tropicimonas sp. S265A TaxID=3415134 RepID=UPI003C7C6AC3